MIFLVQFGINKRLYIFQRPQSALTVGARTLLLVFTRLYKLHPWGQKTFITWQNGLCNYHCFISGLLPYEEGVKIVHITGPHFISLNSQHIIHMSVRRYVCYPTCQSTSKINSSSIYINNYCYSFSGF